MDLFNNKYRIPSARLQYWDYSQCLRIVCQNLYHHLLRGLFRDMPYFPVWQPRFYDHIIRTEDDLNRIREYIKFNPKNWQQDENFIN